MPEKLLPRVRKGMSTWYLAGWQRLTLPALQPGQAQGSTNAEDLWLVQPRAELSSPAEKRGWGSTSSLRQLYRFRCTLAPLQLARSMGRASSWLLAKYCAHLPSHRPDFRPGGWRNEENSHQAAIMDSWLLQNLETHTLEPTLVCLLSRLQVLNT